MNGYTIPYTNIVHSHRTRARSINGHNDDGDDDDDDIDADEDTEPKERIHYLLESFCLPLRVCVCMYLCTGVCPSVFTLAIWLQSFNGFYVSFLPQKTVGSVKIWNYEMD